MLPEAHRPRSPSADPTHAPQSYGLNLPGNVDYRAPVSPTPPPCLLQRPAARCQDGQHFSRVVIESFYRLCRRTSRGCSRSACVSWPSGRRAPGLRQVITPGDCTVQNTLAVSLVVCRTEPRIAPNAAHCYAHSSGCHRWNERPVAATVAGHGPSRNDSERATKDHVAGEVLPVVQP